MKETIQASGFICFAFLAYPQPPQVDCFFGFAFLPRSPLFIHSLILFCPKPYIHSDRSDDYTELGSKLKATKHRQLPMS